MLKSSRVKVVTTVFVLVLMLAVAAFAQADTPLGRDIRPLPDAFSSAKLDAPITVANLDSLQKVSADLRSATGEQQVVVRLSEASAAEAAVATGQSAQAAQVDRVTAQQDAVIAVAQTADTGAQVLGRANIAINAVMLEIDAAALETLAANPSVVSIKPVIDYELDLTETVPYIGGTAVQNSGFDGTGVTVAVLDSGIDYTHANLGGGGTLADYEAAWGIGIGDPTQTTTDGLFPTAKVVGGYDFVGELWPSFGPLLPDPDPIDFEGHGTHVADIIGGVNGVAPGASLYAVKVCSAVSSSCSGVALIQGMDFAVDPNGDGDTSDHVDIINMSLGSVYGQAYDDDLAQAVENASAVGVLTVASAGNSSDKPYVHGTPAGAPSALSVAQTEVPSAFLPLMQVLAPAAIAGDYPAVFQPWAAPLTAPIEAPVIYGDGAGGNLNGCAPFAPGSVAGYIVLIDRGACGFSVKIDNVGQGGGLVGIIGLVAPGEPFGGGFGGGNPVIPGYMISQADSNALKSGIPNTVVRFDPAVGVELAGTMVGSSSRGPTMNGNLLKPEIGAPGASVSAVAGSGTGEGAFGGTSGAAPMVSGAAALVKQAYPERSAPEIKAVLINTGETNILTRPIFFGGDLAPITRIGGGEVRVDRAVAAPAAAWDADTLSGALSFGFYDATNNSVKLRRNVTIANYTDEDMEFIIDSTYRYAADAASGAVRIIAPGEVTVKKNGTRTIQVQLEIRGRNLSPWEMNSGLLGADPEVLTAMEYDGYLTIAPKLDEDDFDGDDEDDIAATYPVIHMPWHVLPRQSGDVELKLRNDGIRVRNAGVGTTTVESYSLIGVSGNLPEGGPGQQSPTPDLRYVGYATYPVPAGFCSANDSFLLAFAVNTWERQTHANAPALFEFDLDVNQDGTFDYAVYNADLSILGPSFNLSDGRNVTIAQNLATGAATAFFFTDHITNSGNTVLLICGEQIGMNASNYFQPIDMNVFAADLYFGGPGDFIGGITISPLGEQYLGIFENGGVGSTTLARNERDMLSILDFGPITNNTESGLLLLYRNGAPEDNEAGVVIVNP